MWRLRSRRWRRRREGGGVVVRFRKEEKKQNPRREPARVIPALCAPVQPVKRAAPPLGPAQSVRMLRSRHHSAKWAPSGSRTSSEEETRWRMGADLEADNPQALILLPCGRFPGNPLPVARDGAVTPGGIDTTREQLKISTGGTTPTICSPP